MHGSPGDAITQHRDEDPGIGEHECEPDLGLRHRREPVTPPEPGRPDEDQCGQEQPSGMRLAVASRDDAGGHEGGEHRARGEHTHDGGDRRRSTAGGDVALHLKQPRGDHRQRDPDRKRQASAADHPVPAKAPVAHQQRLDDEEEHPRHGQSAVHVDDGRDIQRAPYHRRGVRAPEPDDDGEQRDGAHRREEPGTCSDVGGRTGGRADRGYG